MTLNRYRHTGFGVLVLCPVCAGERNQFAATVTVLHPVQDRGVCFDCRTSNKEKP